MRDRQPGPLARGPGHGGARPPPLSPSSGLGGGTHLERSTPPPPFVELIPLRCVRQSCHRPLCGSHRPRKTL